MAVKNSLVQQGGKKVPFTVQLQSKSYQNLINTTLRDKNTANRFIASITSAVSAILRYRNVMPVQFFQLDYLARA